MTYSLKVIQACERTIAAYDRLIETGDASTWGMYGALCRLCDAVKYDCSRCPLNRRGDMGCVGDSAGWALPSYAMMNDALKRGCTEEIVKAARVRRAWLKRKFRAGGIRVGKSKGGG